MRLLEVLATNPDGAAQARLRVGTTLHLHGIPVVVDKPVTVATTVANAARINRLAEEADGAAHAADASSSGAAGTTLDAAAGQ